MTGKSNFESAEFLKLNQDLAKNAYPKGVYFDARNIRIMTYDQNNTTLGVSNIKGTEKLYTIPTLQFVDIAEGSYLISMEGEDYRPNQNNYSKIKAAFSRLSAPATFFPHGYTFMWEDLYLICSPSIEEPIETSITAIFKITEHGAISLIFIDCINTSRKYPIQMDSYYESENVKKIYFVDTINQLRSINDNGQSLLLPTDFIDIVPEITFSPIEVEEVIYGTGSHKSGMVAYSYALVSSVGAITKPSPLSVLYPVNDKTSGNLVEDDVSISFKIKINNLRKDYQYIRIYKFFYSDFIAAPIITLISESELLSTSFTLVDDNNLFVSNVGLSDFLSIGSEVFIPKTFVIEQDFLFTSNNKYIKRDVDIDFRAYRFNSGSQILLRDVNNVLSGYNTSNWTTIPKNADCINPSTRAEPNNNAQNNGFDGLDDTIYYETNKYIYTSGGVEYGAEGPNIIIRLVNKQSPGPVYDNTKTYSPLKSSDLNYRRSKNFEENKSFRLDEVYRIGIVLKDKNGASSFVNWVCDFRFPNHDTHPIYFGGTIGKLNNYQLDVRLKESAISQLKSLGYVSYQVVYVPRTKANKTVLASGIAGLLMDTTSDTFTVGGGAYSCPPQLMLVGNDGLNNTNPQGIQRSLSYRHITPSKQNFNVGKLSSVDPSIIPYKSELFEFRSNEIDENTYLDGFFVFKGYQKVTCIRVYPGVIFNNVYQAAIPNTVHINYETLIRTTRENIICSNVVSTKPYGNILLFNSADTDIGIIEHLSGANYNVRSETNISFDSGKDLHNETNYAMIVPAKDLINEIDGRDGIYNTDYLGSVPTGNLWMVDYKRSLPNQYGGQSYSERSRGLYTPCSKVISLDTTYSDDSHWAVGDCFTTLITLQRSQIKFPTDSQKSGFRDVYQYIGQTDISEDHRPSTILNFNNPQKTLVDFYEFNSVYSRIKDLEYFTHKPIIFLEEFTYSFEIKPSLIKIFGSVVDGFTQFNPLSSKNALSKYGPVTKIVRFSENILMIQENGICIWSVLPRVQSKTTDGNSIQLGVGDLLNDYSYPITGMGSKHIFSIAETPIGVFFYDQKRKSITGLSKEGLKEIQMEGLMAYVNNFPEFDDNPYIDNGVEFAYNSLSKELFLSFKNSTFKTTIVYSLLSQGISQFMDCYPSMILNNNNTLLLYKANEIHSLYTGKHGVFFNVLYPSYITLVLNPKKDVVSLLTNLFFTSESYDVSNQIQHNKTITHIRIYNDYQDTGLLPATHPNLKKVFTKWRYVVPLIRRGERLRSPYFMVQLYTDNIDDLRILIQTVLFEYTLHPKAIM